MINLACGPCGGLLETIILPNLMPIIALVISMLSAGFATLKVWSGWRPWQVTDISTDHTKQSLTPQDN